MFSSTKLLNTGSSQGGAASGTNPSSLQSSVLSLNGDGTQGGQNNTFLDSSSNATTITRTGNVTQGSFSPYGNNWSTYLDGASSLNFPASATAYNLSGSAWTVECWLFCTLGTFSDGQCRFLLADQNDTYNAWTLCVDSTGVITFGIPKTGATGIGTAAGAFTFNRWNHVAVVYSSGKASIYINGVSSATPTAITLPTAASIGFKVGGDTVATVSTKYQGCISNLHINTTTALYTSSFTPSTSPLSVISGTSLLTCASNRFVDKSSNNLATTITGAPSVQTFTPFTPTSSYSKTVNGGSAYFDGNGDYLTPTSSAVNLSTNWTIEFSFYALNTSCDLIESRPTSTNGFYPTLAVLDATYINFYYNTTDHIIAVPGGTLNQWIHIAVVKLANNVTVYINGVNSYSIASTQTWGLGANTPVLGFNAAYPTSPGYYKGYISDFRVVNGTAIYTSNFSIPSSPLTSVTNTRLLYSFTNGSIFDSSMTNDLETVGNAQITTSVKKYGTGSLAFDGNGDAVKYMTNQTHNFGTGDYTVEFWANANSWSSTTLYSIANLLTPVDIGTGLTGAFGITYDPTFAFGLCLYNWGGAVGDGTVVNIPQSMLSTGIWYHIAFCRANGVTRAFLNGVLVSSSTKSYTGNFNNNPLYIGGGPTNGWFNGYIDNLRIARGAAYTSNFTPPDKDFYADPTIDYYRDTVGLHLGNTGVNNANNRTLLDSNNGSAFTTYGNVGSGRFSPYGKNWSTYFTSADYLNINTSTGNASFTLEFWICPTATNVLYPIISQGTADSSANFLLYVDTTNKINLYSNGNIASTSVGIVLNTWTHVALSVDSSSNAIIYINGINRGSGSVATKSFSAAPLQVNRGYGGITTGSSFYLSNLRLVKNATLVYTGNFTPSTSPLTNTPNGTTLLTCNASYITDGSSTPLTITTTGTPIVYRKSPFSIETYTAATNGGSAIFNGSSDYFVDTRANSFLFGKGNFSIDAWINISELPSGTSPNTYYTIFDNQTLNGVTTRSNAFVFFITSTGTLDIYSNGAFLAASTSTIPLKQWVHVSVSRLGSTIGYFINGKACGTATITTNLTAGGCVIGRLSDTSDGYFKGYISDLIVATTNIHSPGYNFTPTTTPYSNSYMIDMKYNKSNEAIYDSNMRNSLQSIGDAKVNTTVKKFSAGSIYFDGVGDGLQIINPINTIGTITGDFTIESWVNWTVAPLGNVNGAERQIIGQHNFPESAASGNWWAMLGVSAGIYFYAASGGSYDLIQGAFTWTTATWYHVAVTRSGSTIRIFVNGTLVGSGTSTKSLILDNTRKLSIGSDNASAYTMMNGYIEDLRVSNGVARYIANFTPPTQSLPVK